MAYYVKIWQFIYRYAIIKDRTSDAELESGAIHEVI